MATLDSIEAQITTLQTGIIARFNAVDAAIATLQSGIIGKFGEIETKIDAPKSVQRLCPHCGGDGIKGEGVCPECSGDGVRVMGRITLTEDE